MTVRVPQATTVSRRSIGYPDSASGRPVWRPNVVALAALLGTNIEVPSIAQTSRPCQRVAPIAGPRSSANSSRSGAIPTRRKACDSAEDPGVATVAGARPAVSRAQTCW